MEGLRIERSHAMLPKRDRSHVFETLSRNILLQALPPEWLCRDVLERDYGVDLYIEMVGKKGLLTGHLIAVQLKARQKIRWRGRTRHGLVDWILFSGVSAKTIRYWMALQVPVFLCLAEISSRKVFFAAVKSQVRARYDRFLRYESFGFRFFRITDLTNSFGCQGLQTEYVRERGYERFVYRVHDLVAHHARYAEMFRSAHGIAPDAIVPHTDWAASAHLAQTCIAILKYLGGNSAVLRLEMEIARLPKVNVLRNPEPNGQVYRATLRLLHPAFTRCLNEVKRYVTRTQAAYWQSTDPAVYALCSTLPEGKLSALAHTH
ncbi:MAG: DUF4365 domain-containing protein [Nitrospirae bacterium]|nr:MAG: DUF4365 domain-containing protein [Nitrospirota bacterium]